MSWKWIGGSFMHGGNRCGARWKGRRGEGPVERLEQEVRQLRDTLARKVMEADFLRGALQRIEARRRSSEGSGVTVSTKKSKK